MLKVLSHLPSLLKHSYQEWRDDDASRLAAALAYYTIFSLAPLLVLVIAITGLIWQQDVVRTQLLKQIGNLVGPQGASFISGLIANKGTTGQSIFATVIGIITLLFGALGAFEALHHSLNIIWDVEEEKPKGFMQSIKKQVVDRFLSFTVILGIGFLLLVTLVISTGLTAFQTAMGSMFPLPPAAMQLINLAISIGVITVLFALMFKILPDADISWHDVWLGAFGTAILFSVGKTLIGLYLGNSNVASSYGAAGSLILLLLWIYYSAQILFFGAEFTQVYANTYGSKIVPEAGAKSIAAKSAEPHTEPSRRLTPRPGLPAQAPIAVTGRTTDNRSPAQLERKNRQTVQALTGMVVTSFVMGAVATIFGLRKRL
ncbi:MAG: YihY/virulence factor BrkB family protein [Anaerolineae bacterium]